MLCLRRLNGIVQRCHSCHRIAYRSIALSPSIEHILGQSFNAPDYDEMESESQPNDNNDSNSRRQIPLNPSHECDSEMDDVDDAETHHHTNHSSDFSLVRAVPKNRRSAVPGRRKKTVHWLIKKSTRPVAYRECQKCGAPVQDHHMCMQCFAPPLRSRPMNW